MSFSKEFRYRNLGTRRLEFRHRQQPNYLIIGGAAVLLFICCACAGLVIGLRLTPRPLSNPLAASNPPATKPKATATADLAKQVALKDKGLGENGLEVTVLTFQRPLEVKGLTKTAPDEEFVLVSLRLHHTKSGAAPIPVAPAQFKLKGDGGLSYDANPSIAGIDNQMTPQDAVTFGKDIERELIFQIAKDDTGLKLYWTAGKTTRVFVLEPEK